MPDGSAGKCPTCRVDIEYLGSPVRFFFSELRTKGSPSDAQFHGNGYQG